MVSGTNFHPEEDLWAKWKMQEAKGKESDRVQKW